MENNKLNITRMKLIRKGYLNQKDLQMFLGVGKKRAKIVYDSIIDNITKEGKSADTLGIPTFRALKYMGLTEDDIRRFADDEKREINFYDSKEGWYKRNMDSSCVL